MTTFYDDSYIRAKISAGFTTSLGYYNDFSVTKTGQDFLSASTNASTYSKTANRISLDLVNEDGVIPKDIIGTRKDIPFNEKIISEIHKIAIDMAAYGDIRVEDAEAFLYILITIDDFKVMKKLAEVCDIPELADETIINDPYAILAIPHLEKLAFIADAILAIINAYKKFRGIIDHEQKTYMTASVASDIIEAITGVSGLLFTNKLPVDGSDVLATYSSSTTILGLNISLLLKGYEVPMGIQTNNPNLLPPTVIGERMFGQESGFAFLQDFNHSIQRKLAIFSKPQSGAATQSFISKVSKTVNSPQTLESAITNFMVQTSPFDAPFTRFMIDLAKNHLPNILGGKLDETIELKHADNAVPFQKGMADLGASLSVKRPEMTKEYREKVEYITSQVNGVQNLYKRGLNSEEVDKNGLTPTSPTEQPLSSSVEILSVFPTKLFQEGWQEMNVVRNEMAKDSEFYKKILLILETLA